MSNDELSDYIAKYRKMLFRIAYGYTASRADAEDVVQDPFVKLYMSKNTFPSDEDVKAWLIRVTINLAKNLIKSWWFTKKLPLDETVQYEAKQDYELYHSVMALKPKYRITLHLFYYEDFSVKEITTLLKISETAVTTRLKRGREQFKQLLLKEDIGYEKQLQTNI